MSQLHKHDCDTMFDIKSYQFYAQVILSGYWLQNTASVDSSSHVLHSICMDDLWDVDHLNCEPICHRLATTHGRMPCSAMLSRPMRHGSLSPKFFIKNIILLDMGEE